MFLAVRALMTLPFVLMGYCVRPFGKGPFRALFLIDFADIADDKITRMVMPRKLDLRIMSAMG